jgi:hypothetical protein
LPLNLDRTENLVAGAVAHYWQTLEKQSAKQRVGDADRGGRAGATGGKQMDGFCGVVQSVLVEAGLSHAHIYLNRSLELPGFFRPTKKWDLLVVHGKTLLAAMEFKSQKGPSFGNNFNNRSEEAIGTGQDFVTAFREGAFGMASVKPWTGWVMLLEDCVGSSNPVGVEEPHYKVFPEFRGASYQKRYELLLRRLVREGLYNSAAFITSTPEGGLAGKYVEPADDLKVRSLLAGLGGHVTAYIAGR